MISVNPIIKRGINLSYIGSYRGFDGCVAIRETDPNNNSSWLLS
jgi:hypothetical protein